MTRQAQDSLTYRDAGVDIDRGNALVQRIKSVAAKTASAGVLAGVGGFGALYELPVGRYRNPVLVSGTDGVGTKLRLATDMGVHGTIGIDLVAMCVNDILTHGAEPLFFLDYYATGRLDVSVAEAVVTGIGRGCELAGAALVGGETAEMPGMYADEDYDLAGFCLGIVEKSDLLDGSLVAEGDALLGLASSGPHSNGYSLIRKILDRSGESLARPFGDRTLGEVLLEPTRIYVKSILGLMQQAPVHAIAHITGGGLVDNLPRVLPANLQATVELAAWERPPIFDWLQQQGRIEDQEMLRTFNCGIGMVLCIPETATGKAIDFLADAGVSAWPVGRVERSAEGEPPRVVFR